LDITRYLFDLWNFLAKEFFNKTNFIGIILQLLPLLGAREEINNATRLIKDRAHRHAPQPHVCVCIMYTYRWCDTLGTLVLWNSSLHLPPARNWKVPRVALLLFAWPDCSSRRYLICHYPELCWQPEFPLTFQTDFVIPFSLYYDAAAGHFLRGQQEIKSVGKYYSGNSRLCANLQWVSLLGDFWSGTNIKKYQQAYQKWNANMLKIYKI